MLAIWSWIGDKGTWNIIHLNEIKLIYNLIDIKIVILLICKKNVLENGTQIVCKVLTSKQEETSFLKSVEKLENIYLSG